MKKARIYCDDKNWVFEVQDDKTKKWKLNTKYDKHKKIETEFTSDLATHLITRLELLQHYGYDIEIYTYDVYAKPIFIDIDELEKYR